MILAELEYLARTLYGEARGTDSEDRRAIAHVILNRVKAKHRRETSISGVVTEPRQFSCWNLTDPNYPKVQQVTLGDPDYRACLIDALTALDEPDFTQGAEHYHTIAAPGGAPWPPSWARHGEVTFKSCAHVFYAGVDG